jgi:hypothetical protein
MLWNVEKSAQDKSFKGHALTVKEEYLESDKLAQICQRVRSDGKFLESLEKSPKTN